jgi:hypothetical protein
MKKGISDMWLQPAMAVILIFVALAIGITLFGVVLKDQPGIVGWIARMVSPF